MFIDTDSRTSARPSDATLRQIAIDMPILDRPGTPVARDSTQLRVGNPQRLIGLESPL